MNAKGQTQEELRLAGEVERLKRGDFTDEEFQELCHSKSLEDGFTAFASGCQDYQKKLFGKCSQDIPIDMILFCPVCGTQHIDAPEEQCETLSIFGDERCLKAKGHKDRGGIEGLHSSNPVTPFWNNPPHKSHLCLKCGTIWRPADVFTNGVGTIKYPSSKDNWFGNVSPTVGGTINEVLEEAAKTTCISYDYDPTPSGEERLTNIVNIIHKFWPNRQKVA